MNQSLNRLNALPARNAEAEFLKCCGSTTWAREMAEARPFASQIELEQRAETIWRSLRPEDWLEAFRAHPKIGGKKASTKQSSQAQAWSAQEQAGTHHAGADIKAALAEANRKYELRFGFIYIVCATGKSLAELLANLNARLGNETPTELEIAAEEQCKIMHLRLEKLLAE